MIKNILNIRTVLVILLFFSFLVNRQLYAQNADLKKQVTAFKEEPAIKAKEEVRELVKRLSALVVLPEGEDPVIATVTDKDKLMDQPVFARAENGDKLIIYAGEKKAYLFDEKNNKVRDIIPVNIGEVAGASASATPKVTVTPKVSTSPE